MARKTAEENAALRKEFEALLELAKTEPIEAIMQVTGQRISMNNYLNVEAAALATGLEGIPYVHFAPFGIWINRGYCVQKGQKAVCSVPTIKTFVNKDTEQAYRTPWTSHLFHISQVKPLE